MRVPNKFTALEWLLTLNITKRVKMKNTKAYLTDIIKHQPRRRNFINFH